MNLFPDGHVHLIVSDTPTTPTRVDRQLAAAVAVQLTLLAVLSVQVGLGLLGWLAGAAYALGLRALLGGAARRAGSTALGPADVVTLARASLVGGVTALVVDRIGSGAIPVATLVLLSSVALALDGVDGWVARRTRTVSALGARFDMEVDAFLVLMLSVHVAQTVTPWALVIGAMRYAFVVVSWLLPWLSGALPTRYSAKVVAAAQGIVLVVAVGAAARPADRGDAGRRGTGRAALVVRQERHVAVAGAPDPERGVHPALDPARGGRPARSAGRTRRCRIGHSPMTARDRLRRVAGHPAVGATLTAVAFLIVYLALALPREVDQLTPAALVRIPVELLLGVALLLVLPPRIRHAAAAVGGAALGLLTILKVLDMGFLSVLGRPFDPVFDWVLLGNAREFVEGSFGSAGAIGAAVAAVVLVVVVVVATALAMLRVARVAGRHRPAAARAVAVLSVAWVACLALGAQLVAPVPVASRSAAALAYEKASQVPASLRDERVFAAQAADDAFRATPPDELLTGLRGKDVVLTFVESYGRSAVEDPRYAPVIDPLLDAGTARLAAAGYGARSGWLTSPVAGGGSWMAHATLHSGVKIDNQNRYRSLVTSDRTTLGSAFHQAGFETTSVMPATTRAWPEGAFFGIDRVHDGPSLGYRGPGFSFSPMPDQYALSAFERLEHGRTDRGPEFAQVELTSSHVPWTPYPKPVAWDAVGDGSVFAPQVEGAEPTDEVWKDDDRVRAVYRDSTAYSLDTLISYVEKYGDDNLVLIFLGDHQPQTLITGDGASHDVPITIVAKDPAVLDRISGWGWEPGLRPSPQAPVWPMESFRNRFLTAFGPEQAQAR